VLPPYEERFTRYLAYITADKVRNRKIKNHLELLSTFLDQSREPAKCKILKIPRADIRPIRSRASLV